MKNLILSLFLLTSLSAVAMEDADLDFDFDADATFITNFDGLIIESTPEPEPIDTSDLAPTFTDNPWDNVEEGYVPEN